MNQVFGKDTCYVSTIGLSQIAGAQFLHVYKPRHWINCGQAGPLGWTIPAALGVRAADPTRKVVALSGDYDFQFMIEELAVGAQFKLPYIHVVVNNCVPGPDPPVAARLRHGLLRAARASRTSTRRNSTVTASTTSRWPKAWAARRSGCSQDRRSQPALRKAEQMMEEFKVPVVVEIILERVTNISMGTEINAVNEFEDLADNDAPPRFAARLTAIAAIRSH